jgi:hypothetical protein
MHARFFEEQSRALRHIRFPFRWRAVCTSSFSRSTTFALFFTCHVCQEAVVSPFSTQLVSALSSVPVDMNTDPIAVALLVPVHHASIGLPAQPLFVSHGASWISSHKPLA